MLKSKLTFQFSLLTFSLVLILCSCGSFHNNELVGNWRIYHIFINDEEILKNDFDNNKWDISFHKTKAFYIMKEKWLNIYLERHGEPVTAQYKILKKDSLNFEIYNASDPRFNGKYSKEIYKDTTNEEGIDIVNFYLKLKSKKTIVIAAKSESLDSFKLL